MQVEKTIKYNMAAMVAAAPPIQQPAESMLAGSISMALCYIARLQREKPPGFKLNARILVVTGSLECASQYMTYMNVFFTAQKQNVVLDVCALDESMTLLQQGCDITGGQYLKLPQTDGLLQYLMVSKSLRICQISQNRNALNEIVFSNFSGYFFRIHQPDRNWYFHQRQKLTIERRASAIVSSSTLVTCARFAYRVSISINKNVIKNTL